MGKIKANFLCVLASLILGVAIGAAGINAYTGKKIDQLYLDIKDLEENLNSSRSEIIQLKKNLADKTNHRLSSIEVIVTVSDTDISKFEREQIEIETAKSVKKRLSPLIGQDLDSINYHQVALIIDGRDLLVNKRTYKQKIDLLIVKDSLQIFVSTGPSKTDTKGGLPKIS